MRACEFLRITNIIIGKHICIHPLYIGHQIKNEILKHCKNNMKCSFKMTRSPIR